MHAFESLAAELLEADGYWVMQSFKVDLTKDEKVRIGRPSSPRWEIDLLAYNSRSNELLVVECKSYMDSNGVNIQAFTSTKPEAGKSRYKLFTDRVLREVVFDRLMKQLMSAGLVRDDTRPILALVCGKLSSQTSSEDLQAIFDQNNWKLFAPSWVIERITAMKEVSYSNSAVAMTAKLLLRS